MKTIIIRNIINVILVVFMYLGYKWALYVSVTLLLVGMELSTLMHMRR